MEFSFQVLKSFSMASFTPKCKFALNQNYAGRRKQKLFPIAHDGFGELT